MQTTTETCLINGIMYEVLSYDGDVMTVRRPNGVKHRRPEREPVSEASIHGAGDSGAGADYRPSRGPQPRSVGLANSQGGNLTMGVDCRINLPPTVRLREVANAIGALAGLPTRYADHGTCRAAEVEGITVEGAGSTLPECARIILRGKMTDGEELHCVLYHFEGGGGSRSILPPSTPFWCGIATALVDFFGGEVDYNDSDDSGVDHSAPVPRDWSAEDNATWDATQRGIAALKPAKPLAAMAANGEPSRRRWRARDAQGGA